jgi:hypothetical protein
VAARVRHVRTGPRCSVEVQIRGCFSTPACAHTPETYVPSGDVISARTEWILTPDRAVLTTFDQVGPDRAASRQDLMFLAAERLRKQAVGEGRETAALVAREGEGPTQAAPATLGTPWEKAQSICRPKILGWLRT